MATANEYAQWIVDNEDQQGTADFDTVVRAYQQAKAQESGAGAPRTAGEDITPMLVPAAVAAVPAIAAGANAIGQGVRTAGAIAAPAFTAAGDLAKTYMTRPGAAVVDLAAHGMGLPPPTATETAYKGLGQTYQNARDFVKKTGQFAPNTPTTFTGGANPAFDAALKTPYAAAPAAPAEPPTAGNFIQRMEQIAARYTPTAQRIMAPVARVAAPALEFGSRVLGPASLALHSGELNTGEDAELRRRRAMAPTIR
jgi:hypothetical protein